MQFNNWFTLSFQPVVSLRVDRLWTFSLLLSDLSFELCCAFKDDLGFFNNLQIRCYQIWKEYSIFIVYLLHFIRQLLNLFIKSGLPLTFSFPETIALKVDISLLTSLTQVLASAWTFRLGFPTWPSITCIWPSLIRIVAEDSSSPLNWKCRFRETPFAFSGLKIRWVTATKKMFHCLGQSSDIQQHF